MNVRARAGVGRTTCQALLAAAATLLSSIPILLFPAPAHGIAAEPVASIPNPNLSVDGCCIYILLVLDQTGSMSGEESQLETALALVGSMALMTTRPGDATRDSIASYPGDRNERRDRRDGGPFSGPET